MAPKRPSRILSRYTEAPGSHWHSLDSTCDCREGLTYAAIGSQCNLRLENREIAMKDSVNETYEKEMTRMVLAQQTLAIDPQVTSVHHSDCEVSY